MSLCATTHMSDKNVNVIVAMGKRKVVHRMQCLSGDDRRVVADDQCM